LIDTMTPPAFQAATHGDDELGHVLQVDGEAVAGEKPLASRPAGRAASLSSSSSWTA
jgi:hypothetical protein